MTILITRPSPYGEELVQKLLAVGKLAYHLPLIYFSTGKTLFLIKKQLNSLIKGDFLFFISQNAVKYAHYQLLNLKMYWPNTIQYYTIGYKTSLKMYILSGIRSKYPLYEENSESLLQIPELISDISGRQVLILTGNNGGRNLLQKTLQKRGATVLCCECYTRNTFQYNGIEQYNRMLTLKINIIVVTTGNMLTQLYNLLPTHYYHQWLLKCRLVVISSRLAYLAEKLGWKDIIITKSANNKSILLTLIKNT